MSNPDARLRELADEIRREWAPHPNNPTRNELAHESELTTAERRYEGAMAAFTDVFSGLHDEIREMRRDLSRIKRELRELKSMHGSGNPAPSEQPRPMERNYRRDISVPYRSIEEQLGAERYALWVRAGELIRGVHEKYGITYKQMSRWMSNDPVWQTGKERLQNGPAPAHLGKIARQKAPYDKKAGRYWIPLGSFSNLRRLIAALENLDLRLAGLSNDAPVAELQDQE